MLGWLLNLGFAGGDGAIVVSPSDTFGVSSFMYGSLGVTSNMNTSEGIDSPLSSTLGVESEI